MHWDVNMRNVGLFQTWAMPHINHPYFHGISRFSIINDSFWDTPIVGKLQIWAHGTWSLLFSPHFMIKNFGRMKPHVY